MPIPVSFELLCICQVEMIENFYNITIECFTLNTNHSPTPLPYLFIDSAPVSLCVGTPVVVPTPCPTGHYCPLATGMAYSFPCPAGTYGPDTHYSSEDNCTSCTAGWYCETAGLDTPTGECRAGYYCTGGASSPTPINDMVSAAVTRNNTCLLY